MDNVILQPLPGSDVKKLLSVEKKKPQWEELHKFVAERTKLKLEVYDLDRLWASAKEPPYANRFLLYLGLTMVTVGVVGSLWKWR